MLVKPFISGQPLGEIDGLPIFPLPAESTLPAPDESGSTTMMRLLAEQTEAMTALRQSEKRFRAAFHHAPIGMALALLDGRWLEVNRSMSRMLGYTEAELCSRSFQSITHPEDLATDLDLLRMLIASEITDYQMTKRYLHKQGSVVWVLLSVSLVRDDQGEPLHLIAHVQDVTKRREAEESLRASEEEYRGTFEMAGVGKAEVDPESGRFIRVNGKLCQITGYTASELLAMTFAQLTHPDDLADTMLWNGKLRNGELREFTIEKRYVHKDGHAIWISLNAAALRSADGRTLRAVATIQDVTERKRAQWAESDRREILEMVAQNMPLPGVLERLAQAVERQVNGVAAFMMVRDGGVSLHDANLPAEWREAIGAHPMPLAAELASGIWETADRCGVTRPGSDPVWKSFKNVAAGVGFESCWTVPVQSNDGTSLGVLSAFIRQLREPNRQDLQLLHSAAGLATICVEHHNAASSMAYSVRHDLLTGLPNRICFEDRLETAMQRARRAGSQVALFFIDVDRFKHVNDTFGHEAGDKLLQQFTSRLSGVLRESDTLARMGGDEFALIVPDISDAADAVVVAEKLMAALAEPLNVAGRNLIVTSSMGIALFPAHGEDSAMLQRSADQQMYSTKKRGRNGYSVAGRATGRRGARQ